MQQSHKLEPVNQSSNLREATQVKQKSMSTQPLLLLPLLSPSPLPATTSRCCCTIVVVVFVIAFVVIFIVVVIVFIVVIVVGAQYRHLH
jgi:hypothetical protein